MTFLSTFGTHGSNNVITPVGDLFATANADYNPTGWLTASLVRLRSFGGGTGNSDIQGFESAGATPLVRTIRNIGTGVGGTITFKHEDVLSIAANRIKSPTGADFVLSPQGALSMFYDAAESRWVFI